MRSGRIALVGSAYQHYRYTTLFYVLLLTLLLLPLAATIGLPAILVKILVLACLFAAVMPNARGRNRLLLFIGVVLLLAAEGATDFRYLPLNPALVSILVGFAGLAAAAATLKFALRGEMVGRETLYAALSTYLIVGIFFGQIYRSINALYPGSLTGPGPLTDQAAVYYSFVTLATLGYGDFLPKSDLARGVAVFEVIGGQLFLAVLVARLIGAFENKGQ
jgi:Ion channel